MRHQVGQQAHLVFIDAAHDVVRPQFVRVVQARGLDQLAQRFQGLLVKLVDAF